MAFGAGQRDMSHSKRTDGQVFEAGRRVTLASTLVRVMENFLFCSYSNPTKDARHVQDHR